MQSRPRVEIRRRRRSVASIGLHILEARVKAMLKESPAGFEFAPVLRWGSHLGHLYQTGSDLRDVLVPYFKAGLENHERCLWVTAGVFGADKARSALRAAVGDFDLREKMKQIEIFCAEQWYSSNEAVNSSELLCALMQREQDALREGYQGLRTSGNCSWLRHQQWNEFQRYESLVQREIRGHRLVCMCNYCLGEIGGDKLADVVDSHDFTIALSKGKSPT
jgi:hypothetical protein